MSRPDDSEPMTPSEDDPRGRWVIDLSQITDDQLTDYLARARALGPDAAARDDMISSAEFETRLRELQRWGREPEAGRAIVELPGEWTRAAFEAQLAEVEALPADVPHRASILAAARQNMALFEIGELPLPPRYWKAVAKLRRRLAERLQSDT